MELKYSEPFIKSVCYWPVLIFEFMMFEFIKNNIEISVMIKPLSNDLTT